MAYTPSAQARETLIAITVFCTIAIITASLRLIAKRLKRGTKKYFLRLDDYLMLCALFSLLVAVSIQYTAVFRGGIGLHVDKVTPSDLVLTLKLLLPFEVLYGVTLCFSKCSIICFYLQLFGKNRIFRIAAFTAMGFLVVWATSIFLEAILLCRPLEFNWNPNIKGVCGNRDQVYMSAGCLNVVTDFMVMGLPIPQILHLQLSWRKKLGLIGVFTIGIFITAVSIIRIKSLQAIVFNDATFTLAMPFFWTTLETCCCIINSNLPMTWVFLSATIFNNKIGEYGSEESAVIHSNGLKSGKYGIDRNDFELLDNDRRRIIQTSVHGGIRGNNSMRALDETVHTGNTDIVITKSVDIEH